jgi:hypothetical protein
MKAASAIAALVVFLSALGASVPACAAQKPRWIPVKLEYSVPPGLKTGDEVTTVFVLTTTSFVPRLDVEIVALDGLVWIEGDRNITFESVAQGQRREVRVRLKLSADRGRLSFTMQAVFDKTKFGDSKLVEYGGTQ